jgi:hypothetical protein
LPSWLRARWAKDVEDEFGAVEHRDLPFAPEIALLDGRQRVVEDDQPDVPLADERTDLLDLARSDAQRGVGSGASADHPFERVHARRGRQGGEFIKEDRSAGAAEPDADQDRGVGGVGARDAARTPAS